MKKDKYLPIAVSMGVTVGENSSVFGMLAAGHKETGKIILFIGNVSHLELTDSTRIREHLFETGLELNLTQLQGFKQMIEDSDDFIIAIESHLKDQAAQAEKALEDFDNSKLTDFLNYRDN